MNRTENVYVLDDGLIDVLNKILAEAAVSWGTTEALLLAQIFRTATGVKISNEDLCPGDSPVEGPVEANISVIPNDQLDNPLDNLNLVQFALNEEELLFTLLSLENEYSSYYRAGDCPFPTKSALAKLRCTYQLLKERGEGQE